MELQIPPGPYDGYIFDLDGTLIDTMPLHYLAWDEAMKAVGLKETLSEDLFYSLGGVPTLEVARRFAQHYGLTIDAEKVMHAKEGLYIRRLSEVKPIAPVVAFAKKVSKTHPIAIATGGTPDIAYPALQASGLDRLFTLVLTPNDVRPGRGKPAPDMFLLAARKMGVEAHKCLVFEDAEPGIQAAIAAGMDYVRVPSRIQG